MTGAVKGRPVLIAAVVIVIALVSSAALWQASAARSREASAEAFNEAASRLAQAAQQVNDLEGSYDVVVEKSLSGGLSVRGRSLHAPVALKSIQEFRSFLKTLPSPGKAVALVSWDTADGMHGLLAAPPAEANAARLELESALRDAGFQVPETRPLLESRHP